MQKIKLYKYGAYWCTPCRQISKFIHDFDELIEVREYDIDEMDPIVLNTLRIRSIPVITINDENGNELWRHVGSISKNDLENKIKEYAIN